MLKTFLVGEDRPCPQYYCLLPKLHLTVMVTGGFYLVMLFDEDCWITLEETPLILMQWGGGKHINACNTMHY